MSNTPLCIHLCTQYTPVKPCTWLSAMLEVTEFMFVRIHGPTRPRWDVRYSDVCGEQVRSVHFLAAEKADKSFLIDKKINNKWWNDNAAGQYREKWEPIPFLDSAKVESHLSVGEGLLIEIAAVASDKCGHVITWGRHIHKNTCKHMNARQCWGKKPKNKCEVKMIQSFKML